jgi:RHS repeat-associated protein
MVPSSRAASVGEPAVLSDSLVVPFNEGQLEADAREARRASAGAFVARGVSRTLYVHLSAGRALRLAGEVFPALVHDTAGGPPELPGSAKIVGYPDDDAARVALPGNKHGLIVSTAPIAVEASDGKRVPVDLGLAASRSGFVPRIPVVSARIPTRLSAGVALVASGVSLTPIDSRGVPLGDSGAQNGATVMYANELTDTDALVKPLTGGFELDALLRSIASPQRLYFRVGIPAGEHLALVPGRSRSVGVFNGKRLVALFSAPGAWDAEGTTVPVHLSVSGGDVVSLNVADHTGEYRYPIVVDPTMEENVEGKGKILYKKTWGFTTSNEANFAATEALPRGVEDRIRYGVGAAEYGLFYYRTQGESKIYWLTATTSYSEEDSKQPRYMENLLGIVNVHSRQTEASQSWFGVYGENTATVCSASGCAPGSVITTGPTVNDESEAVFKQTTREPQEAGGYPGSAAMYSASVGIVQEAGPTAAWYAAESSPGSYFPNALYPGRWSNASTGWLALNAFDPGVGIKRDSWSSPNDAGWHSEYATPDADGGVQRPECEEQKCGGEPHNIWTRGLPDGEDTVDATVEDVAGLTATTSGVIKIDSTPPEDVKLVGLPPNNEVGFGRDRIQATATSGSGSTPSSGIASISLYIEGGPKLPEHGSCPPGPSCTATGEWEINGEEYAAGRHRVIIYAEDGAGNGKRVESTITFVSSQSRPVGPGSVNLASGAFMLSATDASLATGSGSLSVERSYNSRLVAANEEGPFGPQWQGVSFGGNQKLTKQATGSMILTSASGQSALFTKEGTGFLSPAGDAGLTLKEEGTGSTAVFTLSDGRGDVTSFTAPQGGSGSVFTPYSREEPGHAGTAKYTFQTVGSLTEPTEALAPPPAGVSCATLVKGCRALTFTYASKTTAGEAPAKWGEYSGRLMQISLTAYNPATKAMQTIPVAEYAYDNQGRLRAAWNPMISPALKTVYGYDAEGHVTAVTPAGQQPWLLHYGTIESDPSPGRLLSVTRPSAEAQPGEDLVPVNTQSPTLSNTSPIVGQEASVSNGSWSNSPLSYSYQWERCNSSGAECALIPGATNPSYTPRGGNSPPEHPGDEERTLVALVTASNAGGSTTTATGPSGLVPRPVYPAVLVKTFGKPGTERGDYSSPTYIAAGEDFWREWRLFVDTGGGIDELSESGAFEASIGTGQISGEELEGPAGIVVTSRSEIVVAGDGNGGLCNFTDEDAANYTGVCPKGGTGEHKEYGGLGYDNHGYENEEGSLLAAVDGEPSDIACTWICLNHERHEAIFGSTGSGPGQFKSPSGVVYDPVDQDFYVVDTGNNRIEYFNGKEGHMGEYLGAFGGTGAKPGQFDEPKGIAVDATGDLWVVDSGNGRIQEISATGSPMQQFGEKSIKAIREEAEKRVREEEEQDTPKQRKAREKAEAKKQKEKRKQEAKEGITEKQREEKQLTAEERGGTGVTPHFTRPVGIAISEKGHGYVYVVDGGDDRVMMWAQGQRPSEPHLPAATPPIASNSAVWTIEYKVPPSGAGAPYPLGNTELFHIAQGDDPVEGTALFPPDEPMGWPAKEYTRASIYYQDSKGRTVDTAEPSGAITTTEYNSENDVVRTLSAENRAEALKEGGEVDAGANKLDTKYSFNTEGTELLSSTGPQHTVMLANGKTISARKLSKYSYNEGAPSEGGPYALATKQTEAAEDGSEEADVRTTTTSYDGQQGLGWKLRKPTSVTADAGGLDLTHTTLYEPETGSISETRQPANPLEKSPHAAEEIYYTAGNNTRAPACGEHPEWAELPCEVRPATQPETSGLPGLPVTTTTYNIWDEPEVTSETVETKAGGKTELVTRTKTNKYDAAGRLETSHTTATEGIALPAVSYKYSVDTGALLSESTTSEGTTRTITNVYNKLGQLSSYTDADGNTTTYTYDLDGRLKSFNDGKGTQTYNYDPTTGFLTELIDSAAGKFTATYNPEGQMLTEGYPNGMTAKYTYNSVGEPTALEYVKTTNCASNCTWYSDQIVPSIEGRWMSQTSTFSSESYSYDGVGRLTEVQETPTGKGCTTRIYAYDADTNRTSLTTRPPRSDGKCATGPTGQTVETHSYDEADRLIDPGVAYSPFGDITALPAADAGGSELTNNYYVDNQLQSMTQHESEGHPEETIGYNLDPSGRARETVATGNLKTADTTSHYAGPGDSPAWTTNPLGEWTSNIPGINGELAAIQSNSEAPVLQLTNLHGDLIATAYLSETATGLASTADTTEFGVPTTSLPAKYSWLGSIQVPTELSSGVASMGVRSYVPQLGRFLQPDPIPGGSANAYNYTFGDPLNETDSTGEAAEYTIGGPSAALIAWATESSQEAAAQQAAENAAARAAAERAAAEAEAALYAAYGPAGGEEEWEEWEEGGGEGEYISYPHGAESGPEEHHTESGVLYQPLGGEAAGNGTTSSTIPLCEAGAGAPCAHSVPCDKCKGRQSQCNISGQHCSGKRGGRGPGGSLNPVQICEGAGLGAAVAFVVKVATGPVGAVATVACGVAGGIQLVKELL